MSGKTFRSKRGCALCVHSGRDKACRAEIASTARMCDRVGMTIILHDFLDGFPVWGMFFATAAVSISRLRSVFGSPILAGGHSVNRRRMYAR